MLKQVQFQGQCWNAVVAGEGEPILLVHGFPLDHSMWQHQIEFLSRGYQVIAPDLTGFGSSQECGGPTLTMAQMAVDLNHFLDAISVNQPITYCGLSMGGYIGWEFVTRFRSRVRRLVQCDTRAGADSPETARARQMAASQVLDQGSKELLDNMIVKLFAPSTATRQPALVDQTREVMRQTSVQTVAAALLGMAEREDFTKRLPALDVPSLLVCGTLDVISLPAEMKQIANAMPNATYVEILEAGHMAPLENPAAFHQCIDDFFRR